MWCAIIRYLEMRLQRQTFEKVESLLPDFALIDNSKILAVLLLVALVTLSYLGDHQCSHLYLFSTSSDNSLFERNDPDCGLMVFERV